LSSAANAAANCKGHGLSKPETFNFLGFYGVLRQVTPRNFASSPEDRRDRTTAKLKEVKGQLLAMADASTDSRASNWLKQVVSTSLRATQCQQTSAHGTDYEACR